MHLLLVSGVHQKNPLLSVHGIEVKLLKFSFYCSHWLGFHVFRTEHSQNFSQFKWDRTANVFQRVQGITKHQSVKVVQFVFFCQLIVFLDACLEQNFEHFKFLRFHIRGTNCCEEGFRQFWKLVDVDGEAAVIAVARQLFRGQQNLFCFTCRWGVFSENLWQTCGASFLLLSWRSLKESLRTSFLTSCCHIKRSFWIWFNRMMGLTEAGWGSKVVMFLLLHVCVAGCSRNSSKLCLYQWVHEKLIFFRQRNRNTPRYPAENLRPFFNDSDFSLFQNLCYRFNVVSRNGHAPWLSVPRTFFEFLCNGCQLWLASQCCHFSQGEGFRSSEKWMDSHFLTKLEDSTKCNILKWN